MEYLRQVTVLIDTTVVDTLVALLINTRNLVVFRLVDFGQVAIPINFFAQVMIKLLVYSPFPCID